jgi:hypothetical protein
LGSQTAVMPEEEEEKGKAAKLK